MSRPHRFGPRGIVGIGLAIVLPLAPATRIRAATTLNSASYNTNISVQIANGTPDTESFTLPVASSLSYSDHSSVTDNLGGMQSAQASADAFNYGVQGGTQQIPPANVHAQGSGSFSSSDRNGGGVRFSAGSSITYQVVVTTINPPPVSLRTVPVLVGATGSVSTSFNGGANSFADITANAQVSGVVQAAISAESTDPADTPHSPASDTFNVTQIVDMFIDVPATISINCGGVAYFGGANGSISGSFVAAADPSFTIDPNFAYKDYFGLIASENLRSLPGDVNLDGKVNFTDLLVLAQHYGLKTDALRVQGDLTGDGAVGFADLLILAQKYGNTTAGVAGVPEPSSIVIAALAGAIVCRRRRSV